MPSAIFPLGNSIVQAIGLRDSMLPSAVVNAIAAELSKAYKLTVGVSTQQLPCAADDKQCCDIIIRLDGNGNYVSPNATGGTKSDLTLSIGIPGVANLTVKITLEVTARVIQHDIRGICPERCTDESVLFTVDVTYDTSIEISGRLERAKSSAGGPLAAVVPDIVSLGPFLGNNDVSNDWTGSGASIDGTVKSSMVVHNQHRFRAGCEALDIIEMPELSANSTSGGGSSSSVLEDEEEGDTRDCAVSVGLNDIRGRNTNVNDMYFITIQYGASRMVVNGSFAADGRFNYAVTGSLKHTYPGCCGKTINPRLGITINASRLSGETGHGSISEPFVYECTENGRDIITSSPIPLRGAGFDTTAVQFRFVFSSSCQ